jgi:hypothetical protein
VVRPVTPDESGSLSISSDRREVFACVAKRPVGPARPPVNSSCFVIDTSTGKTRPLEGFGESITEFVTEGTAALMRLSDGSLRVGRRSRGPGHLLVYPSALGGWEQAAISPDLRWVATSGDDSTLRLWPMPDLDAPPLDTLPLDVLVSKLRSFTNLRAVRDPKASSGWRIELGPFPGWNHLPAW